VKRFGERACMMFGLVCGCVGFAIFGAADVGWIFMAGIPFVALWGLGGPAMQSLMSRRVQSTEQGQLQGAIGSIRGITGVIGPVVMNGTFRLTAGSRALTEAPGAVYFLAAILLTLTISIVWRATQSGADLVAE
jgi:DHA1 family tetracycline resistance protein-like MFS transporter